MATTAVTPLAFSERFGAANAEYKTFTDNFETHNVGEHFAETQGEAGGSRFKLTEASPASIAAENAKGVAAEHGLRTTPGADGTTSVTIPEAEVTELKRLGGTADVELHNLLKEHDAIGTKAQKAYEAERAAAAKLGKTEGPKAIAALDKEYEAFKATHVEHGKVIIGERKAVADVAKNGHVGGAPDAVRKTEAAVAEGAAAKAAASTATKVVAKSAAGEALGIIGEQKFKAKGFVGRYIAGANAKLNVASIDKFGMATKATTFSKVTNLGGAALGAVIGGYGLKDLGQVAGIVGPDMDEQGKEVPVDSSKLFKAAAELGIGATAIYLTLIKGGHNKAMGMMTK